MADSLKVSLPLTRGKLMKTCTVCSGPFTATDSVKVNSDTGDWSHGGHS